MKIIRILFLGILTGLLFPVFACSQSRWHPYMGVHASMDAAGNYVGPSFQAGADYHYKKYVSFTGYLHYFGKSLTEHYDFGEFASGKYRSAIAAIMLQPHLSRKMNKGFFLAVGLAFQKQGEIYKDNMDTTYTKLNFITGAMRFGYLLATGKKTLSMEINASGPHSRSYEIYGYPVSETQFLTQLSLGLRLIF
ncbi:MAG: hypothetical protein ABIT96_06525 [Ferruginibacter sp.]